MADLAPHNRVLVVVPSWVGDAVMATPCLRMLREAMPGAFLGGLVRPGIDALLAGSPFLDEMHVDRARGIMGPKLLASKLRARRYDCALLLTNSFSTALVTRLAFIPRRIGYDRDARGMLLTHRIPAPKRPDGPWAPVPAVWYYNNISRFALGWEHESRAQLGAQWWRELPTISPADRMTLTLTQADQSAATGVLERAGIRPDEPFALLNPGGNNPAKRWPAERFAQVADHLFRHHEMRVLVNAAPAEGDIARAVQEHSKTGAASLADCGMTLGALKGVCAAAQILITNDTGPRHIAAAFETPVVTLFGPTDPRWTLIHAPASEEPIMADPTLPLDLVADEHPQRCRVDRIEVATVIDRSDALLARAGRAKPPDSRS